MVFLHDNTHGWVQKINVTRQDTTPPWNLSFLFRRRWLRLWIYIHYIVIVLCGIYKSENAEEDKQKCLSRHTNNSPPPICAGILKQSTGARNRLGIGLSYRHARTRICKFLRSPGIDSKEPIPGFLKRLQIGATYSCANV
jgi:hypothetical protein